MNIKVGQWVRTKYNKVFQVNANYKQGYDSWENKESCMEYNLVNVANTPRELIEVGDLVYAHKYNRTTRDIYQVCKIEKYEYDGINRISVGDEYGNDISNYITKILTPNSNGGYDLQWEAE